MVKIYRLDADLCDVKCALDEFSFALNCAEIDQETSYWFFINE